MSILYLKSREVYHCHVPSQHLYCLSSWDTLDAQVVCRQLGMLGGEAHDYAEFGEGSGLIHLDNVECDGSESSISDCDSNAWGDENCSHYEDASVTCGK